MSTAWRLVEAKFPWVTTSCCASHLLSLELQEFARIPRVAVVMDLVRTPCVQRAGRVSARDPTAIV
eukprot:6212553-Pleurochrysis_carterae.AAC.2